MMQRRTGENGQLMAEALWAVYRAPALNYLWRWGASRGGTYRGLMGGLLLLAMSFISSKRLLYSCTWVALSSCV